MRKFAKTCQSQKKFAQLLHKLVLKYPAAITHKKDPMQAKMEEIMRQARASTPPPPPPPQKRQVAEEEDGEEWDEDDQLDLDDWDSEDDDEEEGAKKTEL